MYSNPKISNIKHSPLQKYLDWFEITVDEFEQLYYIKNVGWFISNEYLSHQLFFIELEKEEYTPTSFCYQYLRKKVSHNQILELISIKWTNEFLYSKDVPCEHSINKKTVPKLKELQYYLIEFNDSILGIGRIEKGKKFILNIENISKYLFEDI